MADTDYIEKRLNQRRRGNKNVSEETKITLKIGVIASLIAGMVVFILTNLWMHQTDITRLTTNQNTVLMTLQKFDCIPGQIAVLTEKVESLNTNLREHRTEGKK